MHTLESLMALPTAPFIPLTDVTLKVGEWIGADMHGAVITNPASARPTAYTFNLIDCLGIAAINTKTNTISVAHLNGHEDAAISRLVSCVRRRPSEKVELYFFGAEEYPNKKRWERKMNNVVAALNDIPNIEVKAFDVGDKPHPLGVAVQRDQNATRLIRLTRYSRGPEDRALPLKERDNEFSYALLNLQGFDIEEPTASPKKGMRHMPTEEEPFMITWDGRLPENQKKLTMANDPQVKNSDTGHVRG